MTNKKTRSPSALTLTIGQVERDTGLPKDTLRIWERRYGFPRPKRDAFGERLYDGAQIDKLRVIKRLLDAGMRPGKLMEKSFAELSELGALHGASRGTDLPAPAQAELMELLKAHDGAGLEAQLSQLLMRQGIQQFVIKTVAPLTMAVGEAWVRGELAIFEEHLYTEQLESVLHAAIQGMSRRSAAPRVLLTTVPNEQHGLGLLMVETLLAAEQVPCISLGTQTPVREIAAAAVAHQADVAALSFSAGFPLRPAAASIVSLRESLPASIALWVGGRLAGRLRNMPPGVLMMRTLEEVLTSVAEWRAGHSHQRVAAQREI